MVEILALASIIAPFTTAIVEGVKRYSNVNKNLLPIISVGSGMILGALAYFLDAGLAARLWAGGISGLSAVGLFELSKSVSERGEE